MSLPANRIGTIVFPIIAMKNICMFHIGRSGSTVLGDLLVQDGRFDWRGELFADKEISPLFSRGLVFWKKLITGRRDAAMQAEVIEKYRDRVSTNWYQFFDTEFEERPIEQDKICGFEVKFFHLEISKTDIKTFLEQIRECCFEKIVLLRRKII